MSSKCDAVNPNVGSYQGTTTNPANNYSSLRMTYVGRSLPGVVSALPTKTESINRQLLQVIPSYGGGGLSRQTLYGTSRENEMTLTTEYAVLGSYNMKSNPYCNQKNF